MSSTSRELQSAAAPEIELAVLKHGCDETEAKKLPQKLF